jgi:hypothetical protein
MVVITNLVNKNTYYYQGDKQAPVDIIKEVSSSQAIHIPYRYDFPDDTTYINIISDETITEPVQDRLFWKLYMKKYPVRSPNELVNSIMKKMDRINYEIYKRHMLKEEVERMRTFLTYLPRIEYENQIEEAKKKYLSTVQTGGTLLWLMEEGVKNVFPEWFQWLFSGILETIDVMFIILTAIPGLNAVSGLGFTLNFAHLIYSLLRLDTVNIIGSLVSFIPVVGQATGSAIKISGKLAKWITKAIEPPVYDYSMDSPYLVNLGRLYGSDVVSTMNFLHKYGGEGENILRNVAYNSLDGYDPDRMLVLYGPHSVDAMKFANKDHEGLETIIRYYNMFGKRSIDAVNIGAITPERSWV